MRVGADTMNHPVPESSNAAALPASRKIDGQPVSEPPILNYSHLIDTSHVQPYTKRSEAVMAYIGGDAAQTTQIMGTFTESQLFDDYQTWATAHFPINADDGPAQRFWFGF